VAGAAELASWPTGRPSRAKRANRRKPARLTLAALASFPASSPPPSASSLLLRRPDASRRPGSLIGANGRAAASASPACRLAGRQSALEFRAQSLRNKSALASAQVLACVSPAALTHTHTQFALTLCRPNTKATKRPLQSGSKRPS